MIKRKGPTNIQFYNWIAVLMLLFSQVILLRKENKPHYSHKKSFLIHFCVEYTEECTLRLD